MEFFFIVCSATMGADVMLQFKKLEIHNFTQIPLVNGSGEGGGKKFGNDIWPGDNTTFLVVTETSKYEKLRDWVKEYRKQEIREGMKIINLALKEMV
ncbi:MAG: hypothetical protein IKO19_13200 [Candidatus Riflebacteria bacterium]|jgi:hypothetical protein|nr:hypothetical protein [Candidatus Riflebacteria bacterium]